MWCLTDQRQITGLARASHSLRAPCAAISPVFLSSAARQNPLDVPPAASPGLWRGSCLLTGGVSGDEPCCKHSVSLTEVCRVRVQFFAWPFSATAPRLQLIECGAILTAKCPPLCLLNKASLSLPLMDDSFFSPSLSRCECGGVGVRCSNQHPPIPPFSFLKEHLVQLRGLILICHEQRAERCLFTPPYSDGANGQRGVVLN